MFVIYFRYKPFMWCRSDVRLWHALPLFSVISPLCGVAPTPDCGIIILQFPLEESFGHSFGTSIIILAVSSRGVIQTLVWHQYYYSCSFLLRSLSDPRLAPRIYYLYVWTHWLTCLYASCLHLLYLMSELSCEYFHSTHLACCFGQMWTKAISWVKSLIVRPTPRGVPVNPVRSRTLVTCILYVSATTK